MEERFTKLNDFYRPAVETALRPFTAAPAAAGERRMQRIAQGDSIGITIRSAANDILLSIAVKFLVSAAIPDTANAINPPFYTLIDGSAKAVARTAETVYDHKKTCYSEKGNA